MASRARFERELLPAIVATGSLGAKKFNIVKLSLSSEEKGDDHFTSSTEFVSLVIQFPGQIPENHDMVVKLPPDDEFFRKYISTEQLFYNEVVMYTEVIPAMENFLRTRSKVSLKDYNLFPKCYYAKWENGKGFVALEDMRHSGFQVCRERVVLDYDHCVVLLRDLGRFHAISFGMKELDPDSLFRLAKKFKETMFGDDDFYKITLSRTVEYLDRKNELDKETRERFKERVKDPFNLMKDLVIPKEPLAVLCHGDFCRNNVMFRYENGKPCQTKFFDFQTPRYGSPAIDLTFLCFLNTTSDFRGKYWDQMLEVYHNSLVQSVADIMECSVFEVKTKYPFEVITKEFRDYAFYGYILCNFFLPEMVMGPTEQINHDEMARRTLVDLAEAYRILGGEECSAMVAEIVKDMAGMGAF